MRTKTTILSAVALAAGLASVGAQVYSANIVGYVNRPAQNGFSVQSNPFKPAGGLPETGTNVISNPYDPIAGQGPWDGSSVYVWNGTSYTIYNLDSNPADRNPSDPLPASAWTGYVNGPGFIVAPPNFSAGVGFYFNNGTGTSNVLTFIGEVRGFNGTTASNTVVIPNQLLTLTASSLPLGGALTSSLQFSNKFDAIAGQGPLDGCQIQIPLVNAAGQQAGFTIINMDSNPADRNPADPLPASAWTGYVNGPGFIVPEPQIPVGSSFFFVNQVGTTVSWTQKITP